ncbi:MAG TPA: glycosyltransferase family 4 protein [Acidimicrobiales bacterium]|nr:glycosyltransferase family 4 protein [Acidimicrobiales bacterium]
MSRCAIVSFRLGLTDGVSIVADTWRHSLEALGWDTVTVAGEGPVDRTVPGLALGAAEPPSPGEIEAALADVDLVVVENALTIPMNLPATRALAATLRDRPALLHHHDPPWQREHFAHVTELPPDDPAWRHVTINRFTATEMASRGIAATCIPNGFDPDPPPGDRAATRARLGVGDDERLMVHPVRAIPRKRVDVAVAVTEALGGTYWLVGPAEDGYGDELERILAAARCPVRREGDVTPADFYAAADLVVFPSSWEGFGNPPVEAATHGRPALVGHYPAADELRELGFRWFAPDEIAAVDALLTSPDDELVEHNRSVARTHLSLDRLTERIGAVLDAAGWLP